MSKVFDIPVFGSDVGTFVQLMGTAGGFGCVACGIVGGFTTGVMALACIHGKTVAPLKPLGLKLDRNLPKLEKTLN